MELPVWLIPILTAGGAGAILGKLVDWLLNRRKSRTSLDSLIIQELRKEIEHLGNIRDEVRELRTEVRELRGHVNRLEEEADNHRATLRRRNDFYDLAVSLVENEPTETLRSKLQQLLADMKALVQRV